MFVEAVDRQLWRGRGSNSIVVVLFAVVMPPLLRVFTTGTSKKVAMKLYKDLKALDEANRSLQEKKLIVDLAKIEPEAAQMLDIMFEKDEKKSCCPFFRILKRRAMKAVDPVRSTFNKTFFPNWTQQQEEIARELMLNRQRDLQRLSQIHRNLGDVKRRSAAVDEVSSLLHFVVSIYMTFLRL
jgi:hypothetical protein